MAVDLRVFNNSGFTKSEKATVKFLIVDGSKDD